MAECGKYVGQGTVTWPCTVEVVGGSPHAGPCMARENIRSVQLRRQWESGQGSEKPPSTVPTSKIEPVIEPTVSTRTDPNPQRHPRSEGRNLPTGRPVTVADLGMQGAPKSAVEGLLQEEQREGRRNHPAEDRRLGRVARGEEDEYESPEALLARTAGGVNISGVEVSGEGPPPDYAALTRTESRTQDDDGEPVVFLDDPVGDTEAFEIQSSLAPSGLKTRPEDQPLPIQSDEQPCIQDLLIEDIGGRKAVGISRYGTGLQPFNGRNVDQDLYEEILDAATYMRQRLYERELAGIWLYELTETLEDLFPNGIPRTVESKLVQLASVFVIPE